MPATPDTSAPPGAMPPAPAALAVSAGVLRAPAEADAPVRELAAGWNDAGFDLLRRQASDGNVVFSPASIGHALLMAEAAADDATRAAIATAFALPPRAHDAWNRLDQELAAARSEQVSVTIADRIWPHLDVRPEQAWVDLLATRHGADVVPLDLRGDPEGSREVINAWVAERTESLVPELLPPGFVDPRSVLVLTDTVHFAAEWARPFGKYGPVAGAFTTLDGEVVPTEFMRELELADRRGRGDGFVGAEIPYAGGDFSMLVLVPEVGRDAELLARLDQTLLDEIDASFGTGPYELLLPRWEDDTRIDLLPWLEELGIAPGAYPSIAPAATLDGAVHAADVAVDEHGTVAAAATALAFDESGPAEPELTVAAERPFVYLVRHRPSGLVLFLGRVVDPR